MGAFLDKPKTEKSFGKGEGNKLKYSWTSMQGWRIEMEDAHCAKIGISEKLPDWSFFGVFDGHAGATVAIICSHELLNRILNQNDFLERGKPTVSSVQKAVKGAFVSFDSNIRSMPEFEGGEDKSGSTATCALISSTHIFLLNCGDSRSMLVRSGKPPFVTEDHKPTNPVERKRIEDAGGTVIIQRVNGSLAVSRAIGDFDYKNVDGKTPLEQLVSPEPDVYVIERTPQDEFLILACDGIWDVMSNEEVADFVTSRLHISNNLVDVTTNVVDTCLYKGSRDNMSIILVTFEGAPKLDAKKIDAERKLEQKIKEAVTKIIASGTCEPTETSLIMQQLCYAKFENLPPGGGLQAKQTFIETYINSLSSTSTDPSKAAAAAAANKTQHAISSGSGDSSFSPSVASNESGAEDHIEFSGKQLSNNAMTLGSQDPLNIHNKLPATSQHIYSAEELSELIASVATSDSSPLSSSSITTTPLGTTGGAMTSSDDDPSTTASSNTADKPDDLMPLD